MKDKENSNITWGTVYDYLNWRGDLTFSQSKFNVVDGLIFSVFAYLNFPVKEGEEATSLPECVDRLNNLSSENQYDGIFIMKDNAIQLANEAVKCQRYREIKISDTSIIKCEADEKQFGAMTFTLPDDSIFIAYGGTDDSLYGWKENFNMAFISGTPSQLEATNYARAVIKKHNKKVRIGGHSKGGNLAVWAGAHIAEEFDDLLEFVYNYDGPGFLQEFIDSKEFTLIQDRVFSFVPESSIVGVLMANCNYLTIKSDGLSVMQHNPFSWHIVGKRFDYNLNRSRSGKIIQKYTNDFILSLSKEEREKYVEEIYSVFKSTDASTLKDIESHKFHHIVHTLPKVARSWYRTRKMFKNKAQQTDKKHSSNSNGKKLENTRLEDSLRSKTHTHSQKRKLSPKQMQIKRQKQLQRQRQMQKQI